MSPLQMCDWRAGHDDVGLVVLIGRLPGLSLLRRQAAKAIFGMSGDFDLAGMAAQIMFAAAHGAQRYLSSWLFREMTLLSRSTSRRCFMPFVAMMLTPRRADAASA